MKNDDINKIIKLFLKCNEDNKHKVLTYLISKYGENEEKDNKNFTNNCK